MLTLYIDSSKTEEVTVRLLDEKKTEALTIETREKKRSQVILSSIQKILHKNGKSLQDITMIDLYEGAGSYTGRRVGASVANALAYALNVPIKGKKIGEFVYPSYE